MGINTMLLAFAINGSLLTAKIQNNVMAHNCVLYTRNRIESLPNGLFYLSQKKSIINSYEPDVGSAVVIRTKGVYGHLAYVEAIEEEWVLISETNYKSGYLTMRWVSRYDKSILGYYIPNTIRAV